MTVLKKIQVYLVVTLTLNEMQHDQSALHTLYMYIIQLLNATGFLDFKKKKMSALLS